MNDLSIDVFNAQMRSLAEYIGCDLPEPHQLTYYFREFRGCTEMQFIGICENVRRSNKARWFPYIAAFHAARTESVAGQAYSTPPSPMPVRGQAWRDEKDEEVHRTVPQCIEENAIRARYVECCCDAMNGSTPFTKEERDELWAHLGGASVPRGSWQPSVRRLVKGV